MPWARNGAARGQRIRGPVAIVKGCGFCAIVVCGAQSPRASANSVDLSAIAVAGGQSPAGWREPSAR